MGIKKLTVENAQIKTASVEVKTLTISGKQVTLAVFRQIPHEEYPRREFMRHPIWGWVNYHESECKYRSHPHKHIVWQKGGELRTDRIYPHDQMWAYCETYTPQLFIAV